MGPSAPVLPNFIGGSWRVAEADGSLEVPDPATGETIANLPLSTSAEVARAVAAARGAFPDWRATPPTERVRLLARGRALLLERSEAIVQQIARENGKLREEAAGSLRRGLESVEFALAAPTLLHGASLAQVARGIDVVERREPVGVVAGITPFNFPAMIPLWMAPLALACGNTFVLKPSERAPATSGLLVEAFHEAGLPSGVLNLVHGARATVEALLDHPSVDAVAFVGSAPVARAVYARGAAAGKRVLALAGAKNHCVVMPDADLGASVEAIVASAFGAAGERCLAVSVVVAVEPVGDPLVAALAHRVRSLRVGPASDPASEMGPVIRAEHQRRIAEWVERGRAEGAEVVAVGTVPHDATGFFLPPTLLDRVRPEMAIAREEVFGPVLGVVRVASLAEAIAVANRSRFGNAASIFTRDGGAARTFTDGIEAGMVGVNIGVAAPPASFPFVGWKGSVYGDLAATGRPAVDFYTRPKTVISRWF